MCARVSRLFSSALQIGAGVREDTGFRQQEGHRTPIGLRRLPHHEEVSALPSPLPFHQQQSVRCRLLRSIECREIFGVSQVVHSRDKRTSHHPRILCCVLVQHFQQHRSLVPNVRHVCTIHIRRSVPNTLLGVGVAHP